MNKTDQEIAIKEEDARKQEGERTPQERFWNNHHNHSILDESSHKRKKRNLTLTIPEDTLKIFRDQYPKVCISCYLESHILMDLRK